MGNENLKLALQRAGLQPDDLAEIVEVDVKSVRRWLSGMAPYPRHRGKVARALDSTELDLWPELSTTSPTRRSTSPAGDLVAAYAIASDPAAPDWHGLMRGATAQIDLLDETLIHVLGVEGVPRLLADKAVDGCEVRVLVAEPDSPWVTPAEGTRRRTDSTAAQEEHQPHRQHEADVKARAWQQASRRAHDLLQPLVGRPRIEIRGYLSPRYNTILRFDDQMLVSLHLWGQPTLSVPMLHLRRQAPDGLFDRFAEHFDALWTDASLPVQYHRDTQRQQRPVKRRTDGQPASMAKDDPDQSPQLPASPQDPPLDPARPRRWPRRPARDSTSR